MMKLREKIALIVPTPSMTPEEMADAILDLSEIREMAAAKVELGALKLALLQRQMPNP